MTVRRSHVPEISRGRLTVTSSLVKTTGAPPWLSAMDSIVTRAAVCLSHERAAVLATESQTSTTFVQAANSGPEEGHFLVAKKRAKVKLAKILPLGHGDAELGARRLLFKALLVFWVPSLSLPVSHFVPFKTSVCNCVFD